MHKSRQNLFQKVMKGSIWVFSLKVSELSISVCGLIILGRILTPKDFGLIGIATIAMAVLETDN